MAKKIAQQEQESEVTTPENSVPETTAQAAPVAVQNGGENPPENTTPATPALETLAELANRYRVPAWQQAALVRFMGWAEGRQVTATDYAAALDNLKNRRVGGGRME